MLRSIWSGAINFGLVNIPVKLYNAVRKKDIKFHQLSASDGTRISYKKVSTESGKEVSAESIVKGYEIAPERYVVIKPEELEALASKNSKSIDIEDFVLEAEIDPLYYHHTYYVVPDRGSLKAYSLLLNAMSAAKKTAVAKIVMREKQYLVALRPSGTVITLSTMFFHDEVTPLTQIDELQGLNEVKPNDRELKIAKELINSLSASFDPAKYHDEYREKLLKLIESKSEGDAVVIQPSEVSENKVVDLMSALEASIAAIKKSDNFKKARRKKKIAQ